MERIEAEFILKTGKAVRDAEQLESQLDNVAKSAENAKEQTESLAESIGQSNVLISLLDKATGGYASKIKKLVDVYKEFRGRIQGVTAAQIKANLAFLANPVVLVTTAVVGLTAAFAKYASNVTDGVVPVTETLKNAFLSFGNATKFARLQAESFTKNSIEQQSERFEQAIAIAQAYGQNTLDLEIELAEKRLSILKEGEEGYIQAQTQLAVLRARKAVEEAKAIETKREEGRQEAIKQIEEAEKLRLEQEEIQKLQDEFDKGFLEEEAYQAGRDAVLGKPKEGVDDDVALAEASGFVDEADIDFENDPELLYQVKLGKALIEVEEEKNKKLKAAREDLFLNLASIFGAESKLGKAMLVAKQLQNATELALEFKKTITLSAQSAKQTTITAAGALARGSVATAEGAAQTAKIGFPQNIPLLIAYAAQAAGIVAAIKQATSSAGISVATPSFVPTTVTNRPQIVPNVTPVGASGINQLAETIQGQQRQPVKAYVVSSDVTTAQSLERNIITGASI